MVRDLEQIKENEENQFITKKERGGNNGHHCKCRTLFLFSFISVDNNTIDTHMHTLGYFILYYITFRLFRTFRNDGKSC